ncbi:type II toxin-antitoxin system RelE/ParE family toxin [Desulfosarcina alkanivorans]|uniref:type II toxin-antitoxin system RelE/ParE family toxin n=1 Tax=Desulfosarcina alkanivorans TaxID=571177 RepID=UPI002F427807
MTVKSFSPRSNNDGCQSAYFCHSVCRRKVLGACPGQPNSRICDPYIRWRERGKPRNGFLSRLGNPLNYQALIMIDNCHVTVYSVSMIKSFANKETQRLFVSGKSKRMPSDLLRRAIRRLEFIHFANDINDLLVPPSNRLHALKGDRKGQHSISINDQWRICFRFIEGDAYDVEITDYH